MPFGFLSEPAFSFAGIPILARLFDWRDALIVVKPETFVKWHRTAFRLMTLRIATVLTAEANMRHVNWTVRALRSRPGSPVGLG